jgi:hypothetical protein
VRGEAGASGADMGGRSKSAADLIDCDNLMTRDSFVFQNSVQHAMYYTRVQQAIRQTTNIHADVQ